MASPAIRVPRAKHAPVSPRAISQQVVVIVGGSSGIGRETAIRLGKAGARVVLAARGIEALEAVAEEIADAGGEAKIVPTDISKREDVDRLAAQALSTYGRIDTWINDAGISEYALFEEMTPDEIDQIVRVNLLGTIHGCRAVLPVMRQQGYGMIINVGSVVSQRAIPLQSIYSASKFGVRGFTDALRMELEHEESGITVTLVMPPSTNTPFFNHARSKMGVKPQPLPPVYDVPIVADAILFALTHPRRDVLIGGAGKLLELMERISPRLADWWMINRGRAFKGQQTNEPDDGVDTMFRPEHNRGRSRGDFTNMTKSTSIYTPVELRPAVKAMLCAGAAAGLGAGLLLLRRRLHERDQG